MPFITLESPNVIHRGMQLDDTGEQMAELIQGIHNVGTDGLLLYAQPEGFWENDSWHWRLKVQPAFNGVPIGEEQVGTAGMWVIIAVEGSAIRQIDIMTDDERLAKGLLVP